MPAYTTNVRSWNLFKTTSTGSMEIQWRSVLGASQLEPDLSSTTWCLETANKTRYSQELSFKVRLLGGNGTDRARSMIHTQILQASLAAMVEILDACSRPTGPAWKMRIKCCSNQVVLA